MNNRILILSVSRKVSLVKAFKEAGWFIVGQDINPNTVALKFCDEIAQSDTEIGVDLILPTRDADLKIGTHRASNETIDICTDKVRFSKWCEANGFLTPKTLWVERTRDRGNIGKSFVKPRFSSSSNKSEGLVECVYQEVIEGEEYSIDLFADFNGQVISIVPRRRIRTSNGESVVTQTVSNAILLDSALAISSSLHLIGHNVLQCFMDKGLQPIWTDINLRYGCGSIVSIKAGCQSPLWMLQEINGGQVKPHLNDYKVGLTGRSYSDWTFDEDNSNS